MMATARLPDATAVPVPAFLRGCWRRLAIEWRGGRGDVETVVTWLQTEGIYADLRQPAGLAVTASGFGDLTVDEAMLMARQEGFAGVLEVDGDLCVWHRLIDFAPTGSADRGRVRRDGRMMVETGEDGGYVEHWWQDVDGDPPMLAAAVDEVAGAMTVRVGDRVMTAVDRRPAPPAPGTLATSVAAAAQAGDASALAALLDCEIALGTVEPDGTRWRVERSTLPWTVGERRPLPPALGRSHP